MKILITGATGFIGKHLNKYLVDLGYVVDGLDSKTELLGCLKEQSYDLVLHCAWIRDEDLHSLEHLKFGYETCQFFEECKSRDIRVINLGSSSEYGVKFKPMKEDMRCEPINTYGLAKLMVTLHAKKLGFNTLRLFTVTGEGGHSFKDLDKSGNKVSAPLDIRDFVSIEIVCAAIERLIHSEHLYGEIINIGSGVSKRYMNIRDDLPEYKGWHTYPQRQYEPSCWQADITKMKKLLNI